jgi:hypothetical protein
MGRPFVVITVIWCKQDVAVRGFLPSGKKHRIDGNAKTCSLSEETGFGLAMVLRPRARTIRYALRPGARSPTLRTH